MELLEEIPLLCLKYFWCNDMYRILTVCHKKYVDKIFLHKKQLVEFKGLICLTNFYLSLYTGISHLVRYTILYCMLNRD